MSLFCFNDTDKLEVVKYSEEYGILAATRKYHAAESTIKRWRKMKSKLEAAVGVNEAERFDSNSTETKMVTRSKKSTSNSSISKPKQGYSLRGRFVSPGENNSKPKRNPAWRVEDILPDADDCGFEEKILSIDLDSLDDEEESGSISGSESTVIDEDVDFEENDVEFEENDVSFEITSDLDVTSLQDITVEDLKRDFSFKLGLPESEVMAKTREFLEGGIESSRESGRALEAEAAALQAKIQEGQNLIPDASGTRFAFDLAVVESLKQRAFEVKLALKNLVQQKARFDFFF